MEELSIKVTRIKDRWHTRLLGDNGKIWNEMACDTRGNIGWCCAEMLRWFDKLGGCSKMAYASRHRGKRVLVPGKIWQMKVPGKIWHRNHQLK